MKPWKLVITASALLVVGSAMGVTGGVAPPWVDGSAPEANVATSTPERPAAETRGDSAGGDAGTSSETTTERPPFTMSVESIEECGRTCRDVTATLWNRQGRTAAGVVVQTTVHAGESTDGDVIWEGDREVGSLEAGESTTDTTRMKLGLFDAAKVQSADGHITIVVVVEGDRESVRFVRHRDVS